MIHQWGSSQPVYEADDAIVVVAEAVGGDSASSLHIHRRHNNAIIVVYGQCVVEYLDSEGKSHGESLHAGDDLTIPAGTPHRLRFKRPAKIIEWYMLAHGERSRTTLADIERIEDGWPPRELRTAG